MKEAATEEGASSAAVEIRLATKRIAAAETATKGAVIMIEVTVVLDEDGGEGGKGVEATLEAKVT